MKNLDLKFGRSSIPISYNEKLFDVLDIDFRNPALSDAEIGRALDSPIGCGTLEEQVSTGESVLLVVPDATRRSGCGQVVNLIVRRLIANGTRPGDIGVIFATGIHRKVTNAEKANLVTPFIAQRIKLLDHDPFDPLRNFKVGETSSGIPVELDWTLTEYDHVITIGSVTFHYFAGFTGGRKLICPGLASARSIEATHKLAFDFKARDRRKGIGPGSLAGNAVHEAFLEAALKIKVSFAINTVVNEAGEITALYCGDLVEAHRAACDDYLLDHTVRIDKKRDVVIASCGGYPLDIDLIQAHKTLEAASHACVEGGTLILIAECGDGLGRYDLLSWFDVSDSKELAVKLCENYQVNGQTAWSLLRKAEKFDVKIVTSLDEETTRKLRMERLSSVEKISEFSNAIGGYILPAGARLLIKVQAKYR